MLGQHRYYRIQTPPLYALIFLIWFKRMSRGFGFWVLGQHKYYRIQSPPLYAFKHLISFKIHIFKSKITNTELFDQNIIFFHCASGLIYEYFSILFLQKLIHSRGYTLWICSTRIQRFKLFNKQTSCRRRTKFHKKNNRKNNLGKYIQVS